ncbi:MAG: MFS transporter [Chloroflexi bacterium]|nr:MFS transporter [Chloroflexota bacterium]
MTTGTATQAASLSPFAVFRNRSFALLWSAEFVSSMGSALTSLAASILVFRLTGSAFSVGLMLMATAAPSVLIGLLAGVFVDRYDRKRIMIGADLVRAALVACIPLLVPLNIAWLYVIVALSSAVGQFFNPAHESVLPDIASDRELSAANSLMAISAFGSTAIGFAASGLIASRFPLEWAFYINALTFLFSFSCLVFVRVPQQTAEGRTTIGVVLRNLRAGIAFIVGKNVLRSLFLIYLFVFVLFGFQNSLQLPFALKSLHASEFEYGVLEALSAVGFAIGSLALAGLADRLREGQWITISFVGMAIVYIFFSLSTLVPVALAFGVLMGLFNAPSVIARRLIIQRNSPRELRGRVSSAFLVSRDMVFIIGMALAGLADVFDVRALLAASAVIFLVVALVSAVMPGLGQPAAEWRRAMSLLHAAPLQPGLGALRAATPADFDLLAMHLPALAGLSPREQQDLIDHGTVSDAEPGSLVVRAGDTGDAAYFILNGRAVVGTAKPEGGFHSLATLHEGDFFGEIAALTGSRRTANVVADQPSTLLQVPAAVLRRLMSNSQLSRLVLSTMSQRVSRNTLAELPRFAGRDQAALTELRRLPAPKPAAPKSGT